MKIIVKYDASQTQRMETWTLDDLGFTEEEWKLMPDDKKRELLMDAVENEHPYWAVDTFTETED